MFATSKDVAAYFGKQHYDVLKAIDSLIDLDPAIAGTFSCIEVSVRVRFGIRKDRAYEMDRDGFVLLAMGFTGAKALGFKLKYIAAFNEAERRLKELEAAPVPVRIDMG